MRRALLGVLLVYCSEEAIPTALKISPPSDTLAPGDTARFNAALLDQRGEPMDAKILWRSTDTSVLRVDEGGLAEAVAEGAAYVVAEAEGLADSAFVLVKSNFCPPLWVGARLWSLGSSSWLWLEARESDSSGPFYGGARVVIRVNGSPVLDTITDYSPLKVSLEPLSAGALVDIEVSSGHNSLEASGYLPDARVNFEDLPDTVPAGPLAVSWQLEGSAMAEELLGFSGWGLEGEAFIQRFWESLPLPEADTVEVPPGPFTLAVAAVDVRTLSGQGAGGWFRLGAADTVALHGR